MTNWIGVGLLALLIAAIAFVRAARLYAKREQIAGHAAGLIDGVRSYEQAYGHAATRAD